MQRASSEACGLVRRHMRCIVSGRARELRSACCKDTSEQTAQPQKGVKVLKAVIIARNSAGIDFGSYTRATQRCTGRQHKWPSSPTPPRPPSCASATAPRPRLKDHYEDRVDAKHLGGLGLCSASMMAANTPRTSQANLGGAVEHHWRDDPGLRGALGGRARDCQQARRGPVHHGPPLPTVPKRKTAGHRERGGGRRAHRGLRAVGYHRSRGAARRAHEPRRWLDKAQSGAAADAGGAVSSGKCREAAATLGRPAAAAAAATVVDDGGGGRPSSGSSWTTRSWPRRTGGSGRQFLCLR